MNIRISAVREIPDPRLSAALDQPHRRWAPDPLDPRLECYLGQLVACRRISQAEYDAGCRWRTIYQNWLQSIGAPNPNPSAVDLDALTSRQSPLASGMSDEKAEATAKAMRIGEHALKQLGRRVFDCVNAIAVYNEPDTLGDADLTIKHARKGLASLARVFG